MKKSHLLVCAAAALCSALLIAASGITAAQDAARPKSDIAVVHMDGVLVKYEKYKKRNEEITAREQGLSAEIAGEEKKLEELRRKRDAYAKESKDWWDYDKQYQTASAELDSRAKQSQAEIDKLDNELFMTVLDDIEGAIGEYCRENSIRIVFWKKEAVLDQPTAAQRAVALRQINVLYVDKELDITEQITEMLNKKFAAENKEG